MPPIQPSSPRTARNANAAGSPSSSATRTRARSMSQIPIVNSSPAAVEPERHDVVGVGRVEELERARRSRASRRGRAARPTMIRSPRGRAAARRTRTWRRWTTPGREHDGGWVLVADGLVEAVGAGAPPERRRARRPRAARSSRPASSTPTTTSTRPSRGPGRSRPTSSPGCASSTRSGPGSTPRPSTPPRAPAWPSSRCPAARPSSTTTTSSRAAAPGSSRRRSRRRASSACASSPRAARWTSAQSDGGLPPDELVEEIDDVLADTERLAGLADGDLLGLAVAPCSPFSVTKELMVESAALARRLGLQLHTHLAETAEEEDYCRELYGCTPVEYLGRPRLDGGRRLVRALRPPVRRRRGHASPARASASRTARRRTCGSAPASRACAICSTPASAVGLGVDGSASNERSDLCFEVKQALLVARGRGGPEAMTAREALRLGTRGGAAVLGRDDIGSLEPGKRADVAVWRTDGLELGGADDLVAGLVLSAPHRVDRLYVGGEEVVRDGHLVRADEDEIARAPSGPGAKIRGPMTISTHVLDTEPRRARRRASASALYRGDELVSLQETDEDGRIPDLSEGQSLGPGDYRLVFYDSPPASSRSVELDDRDRRPRPRTTTSRSSSPRTRARATAAAERGRAGRAVRGPDALRRAARAPRRTRSSARARSCTSCRTTRRSRSSTRIRRSGSAAACPRARAAEQGADDDPEVLDELARLNAEYEARHGFRFVVFVNRRPKSEILDVLRDADRRTRPTRSSRPRSPSSSRSRRTAGGAVIVGIDPYVVGLARPRLPLVPRHRGDRLDRHLVLLRRARPAPARAARRARPRARRRRRVVGDPRRRLLPDREVPGRAAAAARSRCTGTSGRPTGRG